MHVEHTNHGMGVVQVLASRWSPTASTDSSVPAASGISSTQCSGPGLRRVDRHDLAAGRILVGLEPEDRTIIVDERIFGVEFTD